ncbi:peptidase C1 [Rhodoferax sp.]|uniref:peptidase C1 n=1 Tax=Rhodoferax sp. TaxID=50421 RepID=UPI0025EA60EC|nr:peptidase C1 [Rhodoferax sp.]
MDYLLVRGSQGPAVQKLRTALAKELGADAQAFPGLDQGDEMAVDVEAAARRWQSGVGLVADGVVGPYCLQLLDLRPAPKFEVPLTLELVRQLFPATKPANIARYLPYVAAALDALGLTDWPMVCAALSSIRAETEGFLPLSEFQSQFNTAPGGMPFGLYEPGTGPGKRVGNTQPGDGARFKGRGFVQLTGRDNYTRYGKALEIDLGVVQVNNADLANAPEIAALLLARFLADKAEPLRAALAAGNLAAARKLVNGGSHGLDRFKDVFVRAGKIAGPAAKTPTVGAGAAAKAAPVRLGAERQLKVRKDPIDLKDRAYQPPPLGLQAAYPSDADIKKYLPAYTAADLILDQGNEGACTGYGLACVVNYLRWYKADDKNKIDPVSPRMLYSYARRYDEYAGEDYSGSSCRGALKGWFNHGVCLDAYWRKNDPQPRYGFAKNATDQTLGVYYRIALQSITDLQAAIQAVGAVYVSALTHDGWHDVPTTKALPSGHKDIPLIAFDGRPAEGGGHAFALVGFNAQGFIVQNSWGTQFGMGGFAVLGYADWLANGMDAWVVALGVPGVVEGRISVTASGGVDSAGRAGAVNTSLWWSADQAYQHSVVLGDDGRVSHYLTEDALSRTLAYQVCELPNAWFRDPAHGPLDGKKRIVIYAHGGLNSEADAIKRARAMGRHFEANGCYPLFLVWKTGLLESINGILHKQSRQEPGLAGGWFDELAENVTEKTDLAIESTIGRGLVRPVWTQMKDVAELAFETRRGGEQIIRALQQLMDTWGDQLEIHLAGHSAGSILLGHMLDGLAYRQMPIEKINSIHLYAPACSVAFANQCYASNKKIMERLYIDMLSDTRERDDSVAGIYRKSLLYLVSGALETDLRTPIAGMAKVYGSGDGGWDGSSSTNESLNVWRRAVQDAKLKSAGRLVEISADKVCTALAAPRRADPSNVMIAADHGSFDNNIDVITRTLEVVLGGKLLQPVDDLRGF